MNDTFKISRRHFLRNSSVLGLATLFPFYSCNSLYVKKGLRKSNVRFGVITDSHYADRSPKGTRYFRDSLSKLKHCISFMNTQELDFLIHLGDLKDQEEVPNETTTLRFLQTYEKEFAKFEGKKYHVLGNHDMDSISKKQFLENIENTGIEKGKSYYYFENNGIRFVVLDANFREDGVAYLKGNFHWQDTNIPKKQLQWLNKTLSDSKYPCVIFVHQVFDDIKSGKHGVRNSQEVRNILENSGKILAVFQGHKHKEAYHLINKVHYFTFNAMVDFPGLENNSFSIVSLYDNNNVEIEGYYRSSNRQLAY